MVSDQIKVNSQLNGDKTNKEKKRICVIGVGASGLCALRHLKEHLDRFEIVAYEQTENIGGTWKYSEHVGYDPNGLPVHSSMYKNLHTNLPMEIMCYPDFEANSPQSYVHHTEVLEYLHRYAKHHNLYCFVNFHHRIISIERENDEWQITVEDVKGRKEFKKRFDFLLICTGRYSIPLWPKFDTLKRFKGNVIHSHDYRVPEVYEGQTVAVIGGGLSGVDISIEISKFGQEVIFVNRGQMFYQNMPENVRQVNVEVEEFDENTMTVRNRDGIRETYQIDSIVMATGYLYNLKFIDPKWGVRGNEDGTIDGLYRHLINIEQPTMAFFGIQHKVLPLPLYHQQMLYVLKILLDEYKLPTKEEMIRDTEEDYKKRLARGLRPKDRHMMRPQFQTEYMDRLAQDAGTKPLPKVFMKLHGDLYEIRKVDIVGYKRFNYTIISDDDYIAIEGK